MSQPAAGRLKGVGAADDAGHDLPEVERGARGVAGDVYGGGDGRTRGGRLRQHTRLRCAHGTQVEDGALYEGRGRGHRRLRLGLRRRLLGRGSRGLRLLRGGRVVAPNLRCKLLDLRSGGLRSVDAVLLLLPHGLDTRSEGVQRLDVIGGDQVGRGLGIEGLDGTLERGSNLLIVKGAEVFGKLERLGHVRDS